MTDTSLTSLSVSYPGPMKRLLVCIGLLGVLSHAEAQKDITNIKGEAQLKEAMSKLVFDTSLKPSFSGLKWLSNQQEVIEHLTAMGYDFVEVSEDNRFVSFSGKIKQTEAGIFNVFDKGNRLIRTFIVFNEPKNLYNLYSDVLEEIQNKYGEGFGKNTVPSYLRSNNTLLQSEISSGATLSAGWMFTDNYYSITIGVKRFDTGADSVRMFIDYVSLESRELEEDETIF